MENILTILLAGRAGDRLFPQTPYTPKPGVPFGGAHRIIDFTFSDCINSDLSRIFIQTRYKPLELNRHVRNGSNMLSRSRAHPFGRPHLQMDLVSVYPEFNLCDSKWRIRTRPVLQPPDKFAFAQEGRHRRLRNAMVDTNALPRESSRVGIDRGDYGDNGDRVREIGIVPVPGTPRELEMVVFRAS